MATTSTSAISFGGLSSGLDTSSIVDALVKVKNQQWINPIKSRVSDVNSKNTALASIKAKLSSLQTYANSIKSLTTFEGGSTTSSSTKLSISSTSSTATPGTYTVLINQLAQNDRNYFAGEADTGVTTFGTGTITITSNSVTKTVAIDTSNNTLGGIRDAINATAGIEVVATIVNDGDSSNPYRLVLISKNTGSAANITQNIASVLTGLADDAVLNADATNTAQNATTTINGLSVSSSTNTFTDAIPGVTFLANEKEITNNITVTVSKNYSSATSAINNFVGAYNSVMTALMSQFEYNETTKSVGVLGADATMHSVQIRLGNHMLRKYGELGATTTYQSLAEIGITLNSSGTLTVDSTKLSAAFAANATDVQDLFQGTTEFGGLADKVYDYLNTLTNSTTGILTRKEDGYDDEVKRLNKIIDEREDRLDAYKANLKAKFRYMEEVVGQLKAMESTISKFSDQISNIGKK